jgi:Domain of unknown function (DUF1937)
MSYNYLASPYTHINSDVMEYRYELCCEALVWLLDRKIWTYSPIVHCHEVAKKHELPRDINFWWNYNKAMLSDAMGFFILCIDGWDTSNGVAQELLYAKKHKILTKFIHRLDKGVYTIRSTQ